MFERASHTNVATLGPALTCNGYNPATGKCASKSIPAYVPANQADAYMAGQYGTAQTSPQDDATPKAGQSTFGSIVAGFDNAFPALGALDNMFGVKPHDPDPGSIGDTIQGTVKGTATLLNIVTDLPRMGTILVGGLLIAAGLFSLAGGNKIIQVVQAARGG